MKKSFAVVMALALMLGSILPAAQPVSTTKAVLAYAPSPTPPTPLHIEPNTANLTPPPPPSPGALSTKVEDARARQAIEAVLEKYLRYWGPRYRVAPVEVTVEGEWARGVARWRSEAKTLKEPIHILAHRLPDGTWQALMPSTDGLYLRWLDGMPESLVPVDEKGQLHTQAAEADALRRPQATPAVPPAVTAAPPGREGPGGPVESTPELLHPVATPTPISGCRVAPSGGDDERPHLSPDDEKAARTVMEALSQVQTVEYHTGHRLKVADIWGTPDWAVGELALVDEHGAIVPSDGDIVIAWKVTNSHWAASVRGTEDFNRRLWMIPDIYLASSTKQKLFVPAGPRMPLEASSGIYKLPFACNVTAYVTHVHSDPGQVYDIDFAIYGADIVAARDGWIAQIVEHHNECCYSSVCEPCNNYVVIDHGDGEYSYYLHIKQWSVPDNLSVGTFVHQGDKIAEQGDVGWTGGNGRDDVPCNGQTWDSHCGIHLHFGVHKGPYWNSTTVQPRFQDVYDSYGTWYVSAGQPYQSGNCGGGGTCSAPSLIEPADGATLSDRTITFRWNAVSGCTFNGYTFRVCTSPDVDNLSNCFVDTGEGNTQHTETINGHDNQDLYWGVRAANAPGGAEWAVRRFRIEPGSASGNWNARYDQGSTLWWDPGAHITPRCTENINGPELHKDWGSSPPCGGMNGDDWVGDFNATINFPAGEYVFHLDHDDGVKLWLNGQNIQERGGSGSGPVCPARYLSGDNELRVLLREEGGDARIHLTWSTDTSVCNPPPDPPTLSSPSDGATLPQDTNITLDWNSSSGATEYYAHLWGGPGIDISSGWRGSTSWYIGQQWPGTYQWQVKARNGYGESAWSSTWSFTVSESDTTPPTGQITSPSDGAVISACPLTIQAEASDAGSGVDFVEFHAWYDGGWHHLGDDHTSPYSWNWDCSSIGDQGVWLTIHIWDNAGNEVMDPGGYVYITLDRSPSPPSLVSPSNGATLPHDANITLDWNSSSGATEYYAHLWGGPSIDINSGWIGSTDWHIGQLWPGDYHWQVKARNQYGESDWSNTWNFTVAEPATVGPLVYDGHTVDDDNDGESSGDGDGIVECGETIELYVTLRNQGDGTATSVNGAISTSDPYVTWLYNTDSDYPDISGGGTGSNSNDFDFAVDSSTPDGHVIHFDLNITASNGGPWSDSFSVSVACPWPDLVPSQWGGWQYPIVPSSITGTTEVNTLYTNYPTYIDWGITNSGDAECGGDAYGNLYLDDDLLASYNFGNILAGWTWAFFDWPVVYIDTSENINVKGKTTFEENVTFNGTVNMDANYIKESSLGLDFAWNAGYLDISIVDYVKESSLGSSFVWSGGMLDVSVAAGGGGDAPFLPAAQRGELTHRAQQRQQFGRGVSHVSL